MKISIKNYRSKEESQMSSVPKIIKKGDHIRLSSDKRGWLIEGRVTIARNMGTSEDPNWYVYIMDNTDFPHLIRQRDDEDVTGVIKIEILH